MPIRRLLLFVCLVCSGCSSPLSRLTHIAYKPGSSLFVPVADPDFLWDEVVDVVDNYFRIEKETRAKIIGNVATEGRIDTFPELSGTLLEPWRRDVATSYDRLEATFQTIRRKLLLRAIPVQGGYSIDVSVFKELEDLPRPAKMLTGSATFRNEMSFSRFNEPIGPQTTTLGWIGLGRDPALEQKILCKIQTRLGKKLGVPWNAPPGCDVPSGGMFVPGAAPMISPEPVPPGVVEPPRQMLPAP